MSEYASLSDYAYDVNEERKNSIRNEIANSKGKDVKYVASLYESLIDAYYNRSVRKAENNKRKHCDFAKYASYLLGQKNWKNNIINNSEVYDILTKKYGTRHGMINGNGIESTYYTDCF